MDPNEKSQVPESQDGSVTPAESPAAPQETPETPPKAPFVLTWRDRLAALVFYALAYWYFHHLAIFIGNGWRWYMAVFTLAYAAAVLACLGVHRIQPPKFSWFWLGVVLALGLSFGLFSNNALLDFDVLALHTAAVYWTLCAAGVTLRPATSALLPAELLNGFIILPFGNFLAWIRCLFGGWQLRRKGGKQVVSVVLGVAILAVLLVLIVPLLSRADAGFDRLLSDLRDWFRWELDVWRFLWPLPVAFYLFGLAYGCTHRRHTNHLTTEKLSNWGEYIRFLPTTAVYIALAGVCAVYVLFIGLQAQELFSAFAGRLTGTEIYSQFAREGFFELCRVAAINGCILAGADLLSLGGWEKDRVLRIFHVIMAALTLLILASAARKMLLYIQVYGLTPKRVLTMAFMAMLAVLFGGTAVRQFKQFNLIRLAVVFAALLFCALALCNLDALIEAYNVAHGVLS